VPAEGTVALGQQMPPSLLQPSRMVEQRPPAADADLESDHRSEHPGDHARGQHDAHVELALARQRARRDQGGVAQAGQAGPQDHDEHEQEEVLGQFHG